MSSQHRERDRGEKVVRGIEDIPAEERAELEQITGGESITALAESDMLFTGQYGQARLALTAQRLLALVDGRIAREVALADIEAAYTRDFVGNGIFEVRGHKGRRTEMVRYSKSRADQFQQMADRVNQVLQVSDEQLEEQADEVSRVSGPSEKRVTFRCPNCGHPLAHATDACPKCTSKRQVLWRLIGLIGNHWPTAIVGMVFSLIFTIINLGPGLLVRSLVDYSLEPYKPVAVADGTAVAESEAAPTVAEIAAEERFRLAEDFDRRQRNLYIIVGIFLALVAARAVVAHFRIRIMGTLGEGVVAELRAKLYQTLQRLSLSYYDREHTGRIMARVLTDTRVVQRFVVQAVQESVINFLSVLGIAIVLFSINWRLAAVALLPIPLVVLCARFFSSKFKAIFRSVRHKFATLSASVSETVSGMRVVKSFAQEEREIMGFQEKNTDVYTARLAAVHAQSRFNPFIGFLVSLGVLAVWLLGGGQVLDASMGRVPPDQALTLGTLLLFITYMNQFYPPVQQLMALTEVFQESATAAERIFNIMDMPSDVADHDDSVELENVRGRIEIQNVSFSYDGGERVLKNISLTIEPGEMVGLVGQTGSGKSTLVSLVSRFYDPQKGHILLDGVDLRDIKSRWLRTNIGMVLQDAFLFAGSIKENIAYGRPDATEAQIIAAAQAANAHEFIMNLPDAYDSEVGERGVTLSGGEKQRISIARAILKDPAILILDEATSAVDTATEASIQEAMDRLVTGRTTIAIAHRLSTLRNADRLIVMDKGEIIEEGTHDELIAQDGTYAKLCRIQAEFAATLDMD